MRTPARETSTHEAGTPEARPSGAFTPPNRPPSARRKVCKGDAGMPEAHPAGSPGPPNHSRKRHLPFVARWSAVLLGLWLSATAADDSPSYRVENLAIPESLTGRAGDPARGERVVRDPDKATCLICHAIPIEGEPDPGNIGPPLHGVANRYTAGQLRLRLVDPKRLNPDTAMPSYYAKDGLHRVAPEYQGQSIYSATEVEDVVAYLLTLTAE